MTIPQRSTPTTRRLTLAGTLLPAALLGLCAPAEAAHLKGGKKTATAAAAGEGKLVSCTKDVFVRAPNTPDWSECHVGQALTRAHRVRTGHGGLATVEWAGGRLALDASSQLAMDAAEGAGAGAKKKFKGLPSLIEGAANLSLAAGSKAKVLRLLTPEGEVRLRGTAHVEIGAAGEMQVAVFEGQADIAAKHPLHLRAGTGAVFRRGAQQKVGGLIAAPTWDPGDSLYFALPSKGATTAGPATADAALPFHPVAEAQRYRLEIARDADLIDRVFVDRLPADSKIAIARQLPRGRYFARLQAIDSDLVPGPGPVQPLEVVELRGDHLGEAVPGQKYVLGGAGELRFEVVGSGKLAVQVDGQDQGAATDEPAVTVKVARGPHHIQVVTEGGIKGELRAEIARPSYAVDISQSQLDKASGKRDYRVEVRALDAAGQSAAAAAGGEVTAHGLSLQSGEAPADAGPALALTGQGGVYTTALSVERGQIVRLTLGDGDGPFASADLHGGDD